MRRSEKTRSTSCAKSIASVLYSGSGSAACAHPVHDLGHVAQVEQRVVHKNVRVGFSGSDNPDLRNKLTKILMHLALVDGGAAAAGHAILAQTLAQGGWLSGGGGGGGGLAGIGFSSLPGGWRSCGNVGRERPAPSAACAA